MKYMLTATLAALLAPAAANADTLNDALNAAYQNNPTLQAARASAHATDEARAQARSAYLPSLDVNASVGLRNSDTTSSGTTTNSNTDPESVSVLLNQDLYTGGRRGAVTRQSRAQAATGRESLRGSEQNVLLSVITAYVDVRRDEEILRIRQNNLELLTRQREESEARFEVGDITRTDVAQSGARLAGAQAGLATAQSSLEASRARFAQVVGQAPGTLDAPPAAHDLPADLTTAQTDASTRSPVVRQAMLSEQIAHAQIGIERAGYLPRVSVVGRYDRNEDQTVRGVTTEGTSAAAQLSVPLFEGGFAASRVRQARFNVSRAEQLTEEARRATTARVVAAWNDYLAAQRVIESARQQVAANELAFEGVQQERGVGLRTNLDVLNAQQELLDSRVLLVSAERDAYVSAHALLAAVGRLDGDLLGVNTTLYDPDEHAPVPPDSGAPESPEPLPLRGRETN